MSIVIILLVGIYGSIIGFVFWKLATKRIVLQECPFPIFSAALTITAACMAWACYSWGVVGGLAFFMLVPAWWLSYLTFHFLDLPLGYSDYFYSSQAQERIREQERTKDCRFVAMLEAIIFMTYAILQPIQDLGIFSLVALGQLLALFPLIGIYWILAGIVLLAYVLLKASFLSLKSLLFFRDFRLLANRQRAL